MPVSRKDFQVTRLMETLVFGAFIHPLLVKWGMRELGTAEELGLQDPWEAQDTGSLPVLQVFICFRQPAFLCL